MSAKTAIDRHSRRQMTSSRMGKLSVAIVSLGLGSLLLWLWWAKGAGPATLGGGVTGLIVALFWGGQYIWLLGRKIIGTVGHVNWHREQNAVSEEAAKNDPQQARDEMEDSLTAGLLEPESETAEPTSDNETSPTDNKTED